MFDRICDELTLGALTAPPIRLYGGYLHRMHRLTTDRGDWAVKLLNPEIMARPGVMENYRTAEGFENLLEKAGLPILPALCIGGCKMQCVDGQYLYVFEYFEGRTLTEGEITPAHCAKMGAALAEIHGIARRKGEANPAAQPIDWLRLARDLRGAVCPEGELLQLAVPMLEQVTAAAQDASCHLPQTEALCHNDMDPKNVLWRGEDFRIIDLECVGYANPAQEMLDLAISWGGGEEARFKAFVSAYFAAGGLPIPDAEAVYDSRRNYIDWLEYNAKRANTDDPEERRIAREQIVATVEKIRSDMERRATVLRWLNQIPHERTTLQPAP